MDVLNGDIQLTYWNQAFYFDEWLSIKDAQKRMLRSYEIDRRYKKVEPNPSCTQLCSYLPCIIDS